MSPTATTAFMRPSGDVTEYYWPLTKDENAIKSVEAQKRSFLNVMFYKSISLNYYNFVTFRQSKATFDDVTPDMRTSFSPLRNSTSNGISTNAESVAATDA